jgi:hypothetical protein
VYVAPADTSTIDMLAVQQAVRAVPQLRVAVLPAAAAAEAGGDPAAVPGLLSARIGRGGTVLVLVGNDLEAASTTLSPTDLHDALVAAEPLLHADSASRTAAVTAATRLLNTGSGRGLGESPSAEPHSAGSPVGISLLIALLALAVAGLVAVLVLPRIRRRQAAVPATPPARTVYVDSFGRVTGVQLADARPTVRAVDPPTAEDGADGDTTVRPPVEISDRPQEAGEEDR